MLQSDDLDPLAGLGLPVTSSETDDVVTVLISELRPSNSPRIAGESHGHAQALAECDSALPPVLVHRATMRIIDGMHRVHAAKLRSEKTIQVQFFDGNAADAFVLGVRQNITHGLPLSYTDRRAAALRIIASHPQWSDRAIGSTTGLAAGTVGTIRRCATGDDAQLPTRIGRDGRTRPLNCADGRVRASALMQEKPAASLRQIAIEAGISLGTVRDVRDRLARGGDPLPPSQRRERHVEHAPRHEVRRPAACDRTAEDRMALLARLKQDPSLRFTEAGRTLIRLLSVHALGEQERMQLLDNVPTHCRGIVAELAHACVHTWQQLATQLAPDSAGR